MNEKLSFRSGTDVSERAEGGIPKVQWCSVILRTGAGGRREEEEGSEIQSSLCSTPPPRASPSVRALG